MPADHEIEQKVLFYIYDVIGSLDCKGRQSLRHYFENDNIMENPERFRKGLNLVFGDRGAKALETWIVATLAASFGLKKESNLSLVKAIEMIKTAETDPHGGVKASSRNRHPRTRSRK